MIKKIELSAIHYNLTSDLQKYIIAKVRKLERYIPKYSRESIHVEVKLREQKIKTKKLCDCEIIMHLPGENITAKDTTINMYAAVDVVQAKLKSQIEKYKSNHGGSASSDRKKRRIRRFLGKMRSR